MHEEIVSAWKQFEELPFPEMQDVALDDERFDLATVDTFASGCIATFMERRGALDGERVATLQQCLRDITSQLPNLEGEWLHYFSALQSLCKSVLESVGRPEANLESQSIHP